jgi:hypothetical protein
MISVYRSANNNILFNEYDLKMPRAAVNVSATRG